MTNRDYIERMGDVLAEAPKAAQGDIFVNFVASVLISTSKPESNWEAIQHRINKLLHQRH